VRVLVDVVAASTGGGVSRTRELARTLPALRPEHEFVFVVSRALERMVRELAPAARTVVPPRPFGSSPLRPLWEHLVLPHASRRLRPDVAFSPFNVLPVHWPEPRPRMAVIVSNLAPYAPVVRSMYGGTAGLRLESLRRLTDRTLARADRVFLLSSQAYSLIEPSLLGDKAELIPMAPPAPYGRMERASVPSDPYVVIVGDLVRFKGVEIALEAMAQLKRSETPLLLICGRPVERGYVESLVRLAASLGLSDKVRFLGHTEHARVLELLRDARACLLPSRFENMSRVPIEAMSLDTPVIVSASPSFREACGDAALYFELDEPAQLAEQLRRIVTDEAFRAEWARRARARVESLRPSDASSRVMEAIESL